MANQDYTRSANNLKLLQSMLQRPDKRHRNSPFSAFGDIAKTYMLTKSMNRAYEGMDTAKQDELEMNQGDMSNALAAYQGQPTRFQAETFDSSDRLPEGLMNEGTGRKGDVMAMAQTLMQSQNPEYAQLGLKMLGDRATKKSKPASVQEYEYLNNLSEEEQKRFMNVKRAPGAKVLDLGDKYRVIDGNSNVIGEFLKGQKEEDTLDYIKDKTITEESSKQATKGQYERWNTQMDEGLKAADGIPILKRSLTLLKGGVKTGGWDAVKLKASNFFGVTGEDEAELSANLGRAVLSQLRSIFGAAFTEREGARLEFIEANFGKSTAGNIRLLEQLEKMAKREAERGIQAAENAGDKIRAKQIRESMDFSLEPEPETPGTIPAGTIEDGYRFKGGDPSKQESWEKVGG